MVESIYIHLGDEFIYWRLFHSFLVLAETLFWSIYKRLRRCTHYVCVWGKEFKGWEPHYLVSYTTWILCYLIDIPYSCFFHPFPTCWLSVLGAGGAMPHTLLSGSLRPPKGSSAIWQQQDIPGGILGFKVQSLVDAWQLAYNTVMLLR